MPFVESRFFEAAFRTGPGSGCRARPGKFSVFAVVLLMGGLGFHAPVFGGEDADQRAAARADADYAEGDHHRAFRQYVRLAKKGDPFSQYRASYMYLMGEGVEQDLVNAFAWAVLAAESEAPQLETYLGEVKDRIPVDQRETAQKRAENYLRQWGRVALAVEARRKADRQMRSCTGSRLGTRCDEVYAVQMPKFWSTNPGTGNGADGGSAAPSGSVSGAVDGGGGAVRDAGHYRELRDYAARLDRFIEQEAGNVELREFEVLEPGDTGNAGQRSTAPTEAVDEASDS
ncbi:hypothetical protein [Elongatibacter sediminis]|uniref:Sel1 repeat family protein n=1 Tax=Elongatibacter sediminis TaxID=3119006 RepID=A0AAW9RKG8_9GAMM